MGLNDAASKDYEFHKYSPENRKSEENINYPSTSTYTKINQKGNSLLNNTSQSHQTLHQSNLSQAPQISPNMSDG